MNVGKQYPNAKPNESAATAIDVAVAISSSPNQTAASFEGRNKKPDEAIPHRTLPIS